MTSSPLEGIVVLDLTRLLPGPLCTLMLADLGAEVIKIEAPNGGDYARWYPPIRGEMSGIFASLNRNKRSLCLDLKRPEGGEILKKLVQRADVLVEGFRPGVMKKLGLDFPTLRQINPKLIYCSITGYGHNSPLSEKAGHDINYIARSGILSLQPKNRRGVPALPGVQIADVAGGSYSALAHILTALYLREKTGQGSHCDVSITDGTIPFLAMELGKLAVGAPPSQPESDLLNGGIPAYNVYRCRDGKYLSLGALEPKFWLKLTAALDLPEELRDSGLSTAADGEKLRKLLEEKFSQKTREQWIEYLAQFDICAEPVLELDELAADPHFKARNLPIEVDFPTEGNLKLFRSPFSISGQKLAEPTPAPLLGEHSEEILKELGYSETDIAVLLEKNIISVPNKS